MRRRSPKERKKSSKKERKKSPSKSPSRCKSLKKSNCKPPCKWSYEGNVLGYCQNKRASKLEIMMAVMSGISIQLYNYIIYNSLRRYYFFRILSSLYFNIVDILYKSFLKSYVKSTGYDSSKINKFFAVNILNMFGSRDEDVGSIIVAPIIEEFEYGAINYLQFDVIVLNILNRLIPKKWDIDFKKNGSRAREIAFIVFSIFINAPLFAYKHTFQSGMTLGRIVLDQLYRRYGIATSILCHALWNFMCRVRVRSWELDWGFQLVHFGDIEFVHKVALVPLALTAVYHNFNQLSQFIDIIKKRFYKKSQSPKLREEDMFEFYTKPYEEDIFEFYTGKHYESW